MSDVLYYKHKPMITMSQQKIYLHEDADFLLTDGKEKQYVLKVRDMVPEDKPREKLVKYGAEYLSVAELLAIVLNVGTKKEDVLAMSRRLTKEYGGTGVINQKDPKKIEAMLGIPLVKACQVVACFELGRRFFQTPHTKTLTTLRTASQVFAYLKDMSDLPKENLRGLYLDSHYQVVHDEIISIGSLTSNIAHPREVFRPALEHSAFAVILAHNHPSGITTPSEADVLITKQIVEAGKILGISVLDHVIVAKEKFESIPVEYN